MLNEAMVASNSNSYIETVDPIDHSKKRVVPLSRGTYVHPAAPDWSRVNANTKNSNSYYAIYLNVPARITEDKNIEEVIHLMSFPNKIKYLILNKPSYVFYLGVTMLFILITACKMVVEFWSLFVKPARADTPAGASIFVANPNFSVFVYFVISLVALIGCYAAFVSKKTKDNANGWDLIKFLSGSIIGLISPVRIR